MTIPSYQRFLAELKRRRVFRVMAVYSAVGFVVLQASELLVNTFQLSAQLQTAIGVLAFLGLPVAIVLAWAFEMTPEGVQRTTEATAGELETIVAQPASRRWLAGMLALIGVVALVGGAWWVGRQTAPTDGAGAAVEASIAVLPFVNMSDDASNEYFSDGISEELLNLLAKIPELQVAARTSSFSFKGQDLEIPEIAKRLNVAHVLEGSVRKADDQVRITAQLIRADDGFHMWSETWDRTLEDIFAIQDEIASDVVEQLQVTLLGAAPTVEETDPEAYALFLQARHLGRQFTAASLEQSNALYDQALVREPDYAAAWTGLATNYSYQTTTLGTLSYEEGYPLAREAANRALTINSEYADAYAVLGRIASSYDNDLATAARHIGRALELDPTNTDILRAASSLLRSLGRNDEAIATAEYVVAHDPVAVFGHVRLSYMYGSAGRLDDALTSVRTALSLNPGANIAYLMMGIQLLWKGEPEEALQAMQQESSAEWRLIGLAMAYHALGRAAESDAALAEMIDEHAQGWAYNIAEVLAYRGENDRAFEWLDAAVMSKDAGLSLIPSDRLFANIHDDPRWLPFLESIGKSPEQLAAIDFEVRLPQ